MFAHAAAEDVTLRIDGMETQVRRPDGGRPGRRAFVSGKRRHNTVKTTTISDGQGRTLWSGAQRPGRMHDRTAVRTEGIAEQFHRHPGVTAEVDDGYRGLANEFPDQVGAPPKKPKGMKAPNEGPVTERYGRREMKRRQSSRGIRVEHANAEVRQWRPLHRPPRDLRRDPPRHRRPGLRPRRQAAYPAQTQHRAGARPHHSLLNYQSAEPAGQHAPKSIAGQPVTGGDGVAHLVELSLREKAAGQQRREEPVQAGVGGHYLARSPGPGRVPFRGVDQGRACRIL
ncbi:transposase family protein [Streptomyces sp. NPDC058086]|uniref:transposase family protein n=1 Tax=Streptomyces sp. NPDC058086 TaxID=3346334 RepID=UPI0036EEC23E